MVELKNVPTPVVTEDRRKFRLWALRTANLDTMSPDQSRTSPPASARNRTGLLWSIAAVLAVVIVGLVIAIIALQTSGNSDVIQADDLTETHVAEETVVVTDTAAADPTEPGESAPPAATTSTTQGETRDDATEVRRISPVTEDWLPRDGWTVTNTTEMMQGDCYPSPVALDDGIYSCGANALSANACFHNPDSNVFYCPFNPFTSEFRAYYFTGEITDTPVIDAPMPWGIELDDARQCTARQGGAWGWRADDYVGVYSCGGGSDEVVLALPGEPVVDDSDDKWTVLMGEMGQGEDFPAPQPVGVAVAYYAGWQD